MLPTRERLRLSLENDIAQHSRYRGEELGFIIFNIIEVVQRLKLPALM
jgi:hypothetical protein